LIFLLFDFLLPIPCYYLLPGAVFTKKTAPLSFARAVDVDNKNNSFAENNHVNNGTSVSDTSAQAQQRGGNKAYSRIEEVALYLARSLEAAKAQQQGQFAYVER
jgi:hypothetical protein